MIQIWTVLRSDKSHLPGGCSVEQSIRIAKQHRHAFLFVFLEASNQTIIRVRALKYQGSQLSVPMEFLDTFRVRSVLRAIQGSIRTPSAEREKKKSSIQNVTMACHGLAGMSVSLMRASCHTRDSSLRLRVIKLLIDSISPECRFNWSAI